MYWGSRNPIVCQYEHGQDPTMGVKPLKAFEARLDSPLQSQCYKPILLIFGPGGHLATPALTVLGLHISQWAYIPTTDIERHSGRRQ